MEREFFSLQIHKRSHTVLSFNFLVRKYDFQNRVLSKYKYGQSCIKIHEELHGSVGLSNGAK